MKIFNTLIFGMLLLFFPAEIYAQHTNQPANEEDTLIVISKEIARELLKEYPNADELHADLVPDSSKEPMVTDRPNKAESAVLVPKGSLQWETGFSLSNTHTSVRDIENITYDDMLVRIGLSRRIEARFEMGYLGTHTTKTTSDSVKLHTSGFSGLNVASKIFLFDGEGLKPKGTLLVGLSLPYIGSQMYRPENTGGFVKMLCLNEVTDYYEVEYNVGTTWDGNSKQAAYEYALNNEFRITQKFYAFAEIYGSLTENNGAGNSFNGSFTHDHRIDAGFWYLLTKDMQFDISGGMGLSAASPDYFVAFGFSNRIFLSKKK